MNSFMSKLLLFLLFSSKIYAGSVDFIIGDVHDPERKWGHVSLSVQNESRAQVFDFGRYGNMWNMDLEGDPVVRVWSSEKAQIKYLKSGGGRVSRIHFEATTEQTNRIFAFYDKMLKNASIHSKENGITAYLTRGPSFHAMDFNCTILAREAFMAGFPNYNLNDRTFSKAVGLDGFLRFMAENYRDYDDDSETWDKIWWPMDLRIELEQKFVKHKLAVEEIY